MDIESTDLLRLVDYAERPRTNDWSLRAALTRYAQPQPRRVGDLLELVRRIEFAFKPHLKAIERGAAPSDDLALGLLEAMVELDRLGDELARWAADPDSERPDAAVDAVTADVAARLERLGVQREQRQRPPPRKRGV
jgi:hypothetical protein